MTSPLVENRNGTRRPRKSNGLSATPFEYRSAWTKTLRAELEFLGLDHAENLAINDQCVVGGSVSGWKLLDGVSSIRG